MKQLLFGILFIVINIGIAASDFNMPLQGINYNLEECNKLDKAGQKTGIWIYEYPEMVIVSYYSIGKKNGIERRFIKSNNSYYLESQKSYINGALIMPSIAYYDNGLVKHEIIELHEIGPNQPYIITNSNCTLYQCYIKKYNRTGQLEGEGWIITPCDDPNDVYVKTGCWKYYTSNGEVEIVNHTLSEPVFFAN